MVKAWGYQEESPDAVQMQVPTDMVDTVAALVQDPDAFFDAVRAASAADTEGTLLIEVADGVWIDPSRVAAVEPYILRKGATSLHLRGIQHTITVEGTPEEIVQAIARKVAEAYEKRYGHEKLSEVDDSVNGNEQGEPPV